MSVARAAATSVQRGPLASASAAELSIENAHVRVTASAETGLLEEMVDKTTGKRVKPRCGSIEAPG